MHIAIVNYAIPVQAGRNCIELFRRQNSSLCQQISDIFYGSILEYASLAFALCSGCRERGDRNDKESGLLWSEYLYGKSESE